MTPESAFVTRCQPLGRLAACGAGARVLLFVLLFGQLATSETFAQIRITAAWDPNTDGRTAGYQVFVGMTPDVPAATFDVGPATSLVLPLLPGAVYHVAVRGYNAQRQLGPASTSVIDLASAPGAPTALEAGVSGSVASLSWAPPTLGGVALRYVLSVGTASGTSNLLSEYALGSARIVSGALPPGLYYARVQAGNMVGIGPPSAEVAFRVGGAPPGPPALGATWTGSTVTLRWTQVAGATSYRVEAGTAPGRSDVGVLDVGNTTSFSAAVPAGTYYVRVRVLGPTGVSAASNELTVRR